MRRRDFIKIVTASAVAWPLAAQAQQASEVVPRVGFVYPGAKEAAASRIEAIMSGLRVSGYAAPAQVELVARIADGDPTRIAPLVEELIAKNVDLIIANGPPVLHVARSATRIIPIVAIDLETDPVASGVAASLGRPGCNITGVFLDFPDFTTKWIELLVESQSQTFSNSRAVGSGHRTCANRVGQESCWVIEDPISNVGGSAPLRLCRSFLGRPTWR
jgi:putative ABC transport system substrate-binding protein